MPVPPLCAPLAVRKSYRPPSLFKQPTGPQFHKGPRGWSVTAPAKLSPSFLQQTGKQLRDGVHATE